MSRLHVFLVAATLALLPLAWAHRGSDPAGPPKPYCESLEGDHAVHDYVTGVELLLADGGSADVWDPNLDRDRGPLDIAESLDRLEVPSDPSAPWSLGDGNLDDCDNDGVLVDFDGHLEWSVGGAWLVSCNELCGWDSAGSGAIACGWPPADHAERPTIRAYDIVLTEIGIPVFFHVYTDTLDNSPVVDPAAPKCGDFESDYPVTIPNTCLDVYTAEAGAGYDGTYQIYVSALAGHVFAGNVLPRCMDGLDNDGDGAVDFGGDADCASANDDTEHFFHWSL